MFTKIRAGEYTLSIGDTEYAVQKVGSRKWYLVLDDQVINEGKTRAEACGYIPEVPNITKDVVEIELVSRTGTGGLYGSKNNTGYINSLTEKSEDMFNKTVVQENKQKQGIKPECIKEIAPDHELYWIQNCMSMSTLQQLDTIMIDNPSLFGEIVQYCVDNDEYYCYLINAIQELNGASFGNKESESDLLKAVQQAAQQAMISMGIADIEKYDILNALYKAATRSTSAAYYAMQAGVKKEDIVHKVLELMEV